MGVTAYTTVQVGPHSGDLSFSGLTPGAPRRGMGRGGGGGAPGAAHGISAQWGAVSQAPGENSLGVGKGVGVPLEATSRSTSLC